MTEYTDVDRRTVIRGLGGLAVAASVAGCSTSDGGSGGDGGDGGSGGDGDDGSGSGGSDGGDGSGSGGGNAEVDDYLSDTDNYDSIEDMTGQSEVTVQVGTEANGGAFGFGPPAIRISSGTSVTFEWTGQGSAHNVVDEGGDFESELTSESGHTFEQTFDSTGTVRYYCMPHKGVGMKGVIIVE